MSPLAPSLSAALASQLLVLALVAPEPSPATTALGFTVASSASATDLYVDPRGNNSNSGTTPTAPLKSIQTALNAAHAGTTIHLAPGVYREQLVTKRSATAAAPITIVGPETGTSIAGRYKAVVTWRDGAVFAINHSYYTLTGFTIDGQDALLGTAYPTGVLPSRDFKETVQARAVNTKLIYLGAGTTSRGMTGNVIRDMFLNGSGGECVRMRNNSHDNIIEDSVIQWCGMLRRPTSGSYDYHNGEGVYIGTSPKSTSQPMYRNDTSWNNIVRRNIIDTYGAECVDIKENAHDNVVTGNKCRYNDEPRSFNGSNLELRGYRNTVSDNEISHSRGCNVYIKSDDGYRNDGNVLTGNVLSGSDGCEIRTACATFSGNQLAT